MISTNAKQWLIVWWFLLYSLLSLWSGNKWPWCFPVLNWMNWLRVRGTRVWRGSGLQWEDFYTGFQQGLRLTASDMDRYISVSEAHCSLKNKSLKWISLNITINFSGMKKVNMFGTWDLQNIFSGGWKGRWKNGD